MQRVKLALLGLAFGLALAGSIDTSAESPLEATAVPGPAPEPAPGPDACVPLLAARAAGSYVALSWSECPDAASYHLLRGDSPDALAPLVELDHAGHIDIGPLLVGYYAVRAGDGPVSAPVVVALG